MSAIALRAALRRSRRGLVVTLAVLGLAGAVAAHHDLPVDAHAVPAAFCLAIVTVAGAALAVGATALTRRGDRAPVASWSSLPAWTSAQQRPQARAGPLFLRLQVLRR